MIIYKLDYWGTQWPFSISKCTQYASKSLAQRTGKYKDFTKKVGHKKPNAEQKRLEFLEFVNHVSLLSS